MDFIGSQVLCSTDEYGNGIGYLWFKAIFKIYAESCVM